MPRGNSLACSLSAGCYLLQLTVPREADMPGGNSLACSLIAGCYWLQLTVPREADATQTIGFRSLLLNKCQQEFEKDKMEEQNMADRQKLINEVTAVCTIHLPVSSAPFSHTPSLSQ